jgi:hypothetical protein
VGQRLNGGVCAGQEDHARGPGGGGLQRWCPGKKKK